MTRAAVIGFGSIGKRHYQVLNAMGIETRVVSNHANEGKNFSNSLDQTLVEHNPNYIVVANPTDKHLGTLNSLHSMDYSGTVLVEKPIFATIPQDSDFGKMRIFAGYHMRFHPVLSYLKSALKEKTLVHFQSRCGQHLDQWRPGTDFRKGYSAKATEGGGVLRDLSHELDYLSWLLGPVSAVSAVGGNLGFLDIQADELWDITLAMQSGSFGSLHLNYLDQVPSRSVALTAKNWSVFADLIGGKVLENGRERQFEVDRNKMMEQMHRAAIGGDASTICDYDHAIDILQTIEKIEENSVCPM